VKCASVVFEMKNVKSKSKSESKKGSFPWRVPIPAYQNVTYLKYYVSEMVTNGGFVVCMKANVCVCANYIMIHVQYSMATTKKYQV
jgi:hypothetical protein